MSTLPSEDPYKVLGVPKDATKEAIRSAHRKLVLQSHPDKIQDASLRAQKQDEFQRVQEAYELLSDESRRQQYDETVKLVELRKQVEEERAAKAARRYESPRHSPREFDDRSKRVYEERTHTRSYDDERPRSYEDRSASKKYDTFEARRPARSFEDKDRKSTSRAEDDERVYAERERKREAERAQQSERRRTRDRERRRGHDDKQARVTAYHSDDDMAEAMHHIRITSQSEKARADNDRARDEEERRIQEKILAAREYMERARRGSEDMLPRPSPTRSHTTYYATTAHPAPPPPPIPVEDSTIRRSTARRTTEGGRERRRETSRPRSRGKDSRDSRPTMIVDPPSKTYERVKVITVPHLSSSTSSPAGLEIPTASSRSYHSHSRSGPAMAQAMKPQRAATTLDPIRPRVDPIPSFSRSNTTPVVSTTPRKETVTSSGKLKEKPIRPLGEAGFDSGYSSAAPDSPYLGSGGRLSSSPTNRYTEYRSSPKTKGFPESKIYDEPEYVPRHRTVLRETDEEYTRSRSVSPAAPRPRRGSESSSRPRPSASTVEYASNGRPIKYVHPAEPRAQPPPPMRSQTLDTPSRRVVPEKVHYSPRIGKEDISYSPPYTTTRRTTSHAPSHYARPSYPRAETTYV